MEKLIRYGSIWHEQHPFHEIEVTLAHEVSQVIGFKIDIIRYSDEDTLLNDLIKDDLQMAGTSAVQGPVPEAGLMYLPYLYRDFDHFSKVWTLGCNAVAKKIEHLIETKTLLKVLAYSLVGERDTLLTKKAIHTVKDFTGLIIRVDDAEISKEIFDALGSSPKVISFYDVFDSFRDNHIEAAENSPVNIVALDWYKHCHYLSCTRHRFLLNYELVSSLFWRKLSDDQRVGLSLAMSNYAAAFAQSARLQRAGCLKTLSQAGLNVNQFTDTELHAFTKATESVRLTFANRHGLEDEIDWISKA